MQPAAGAGQLSGTRILLAAARTLFAFLGFSALVTEVATLVAQGRFAGGDFFSYFTVQANTLAVITLMVSAFAVATGTGGRRLQFLRGLVTFAMTTVILIFIVLLSGYSASDLTAVPWDNTVLHYIMPIALLVDWVLVNPAGACSYRWAFVWLVLPFGYLVYSLVRGPIAHWYPYPFMDPSLHGHGRVLISSAVIAVVLTAVALAIAAASRLPHLAALSPRNTGVAAAR